MEITEGFFDTGEVRLHYIEGPRSGPPLLFLHGATSNWESWWTVMPQLSRRYHVYALDQRGHGQSSWGGNGLDGYHLSRFTADAQAFIRGVIQAPTVVYGHSWGAVVTFTLGGSAPDWVTALIMEDPPMMLRREDTESGPFLGFFGWYLQVKQETGDPAELRAALAEANPAIPDVILDSWSQNLYRLDPDFLRATLGGPAIAQGVDFGALAAAIRCPALLLQADQTLGAALVDQDLEYLLQHNSAIQVEKFPGAGHGINVDQTEKLLAAIERFLPA